MNGWAEERSENMTPTDCDQCRFLVNVVFFQSAAERVLKLQHRFGVGGVDDSFDSDNESRQVWIFYHRCDRSDCSLLQAIAPIPTDEGNHLDP